MKAHAVEDKWISNKVAFQTNINGTEVSVECNIAIIHLPCLQGMKLNLKDSRIAPQPCLRHKNVKLYTLFNPFTPKSDQFHVSPVASPVKLHHTVYICYWPSARSVPENIARVHFLCVYGPSRFGEVHKHVNSEREQYSSVRTECEVNKWFMWRNQQNSDLMWPWSIVNFSCVRQSLQQCKHEQSV